MRFMRFTSICWIAIGLALMACAAALGDGPSTRPVGRDPSKPVAVIKTTDGKTQRGQIKFETGKISVQQLNGDWVALDLSKLADLTVPPPGAVEAAAGGGIHKERLNFAHGLKGEYFVDPQFKDLRKAAVVRYDGAIDFNWGLGSPDPALPEEFSARWTGQIEPRYSENYTIRSTCDDGLRLWIAGKLVIDRWLDQSPFLQQAKIDLKAGQRYDIRLEYHDIMNMAQAHLQWESKSQKREAIPASRLFPPVGDVAPRVTLMGVEDQQQLVSPEKVTLEALVGEPPINASRVEYYAGRTLIGLATTRPFRVTWKNPPTGEHVIVARASNAAGAVTSSEPAAVTVFGNAAGKLPPGWVTSVVGDSKKGNVSGSGDSITLSSDGGDVWGDNDAFPFAFQRLDGDWRMTVHIKSVEQSKDKMVLAGGVMIRDTLSPTSKFLMVGYSPDTGVVFLGRGDRTIYTETPGKSPKWLRLQREGNRVRAAFSLDGKAWSAAGVQDANFLGTAYVGVAMASRDGDGPGVVSFDQINLMMGSAAMQNSSRGLMLSDGSVIAGNVGAIEAKVVHLSRDKEVLVERDKVARLLFRPVTEDVGSRMNGRTGVLMAGGDFFEGEVREIANGRVKVSSILFGARSFDINAEVAAIVLGDVKDVAGAYEVQSADGSVIHAKGVEVVEGGLVAEEVQTGVKILVRVAEVRRLRR